MSKLSKVRREPIVVELGGKKRHIRFDLNAFSELEKVYGSVQTAMESLQTGSMKSVTTVLWAGLIHEEARLDEYGELLGYNISKFQVGSWVGVALLPDLMTKLGMAMNGDMPEDVKEEMDKTEELGNGPKLPQ